MKNASNYYIINDTENVGYTRNITFFIVGSLVVAKQFSCEDGHTETVIYKNNLDVNTYFEFLGYY